MTTKILGSSRIDGAPSCQGGQLDLNVGQGQQAGLMVRLKFHQQIDVTVRAIRPLQRRAEHGQALDMVLPANGAQCQLIRKEITDHHRTSSQAVPPTQLYLGETVNGIRIAFDKFDQKRRLGIRSSPPLFPIFQGPFVGAQISGEHRPGKIETLAKTDKVGGFVLVVDRQKPKLRSLVPIVVEDPQSATLAFLASAIGEPNFPQTTRALDHLSRFRGGHEHRLQRSKTFVVEIVPAKTFEGRQFDET
jgi:hypothetical protein